ncbi:MAG: toprim domain-containing protein [Candidatus Marinimicrobia bacterium]|nr:toprim domain-containing protein [Candidatus Neomarinimicrobiota bacterium]MBL7047331.1 toprim domain-containing protein [Candidatus Neomarinimicrobiota bacterium]
MIIDYQTLFAGSVKSLKVASNNQATGLCPFHDDRHISFSVNLETGLWNCFASCGGGSAYDFAQRIGVDPKPYRNNNNQSFSPKVSKTPTIRQNSNIRKNGPQKLDSKTLSQCCQFHEILLSNFDILCEQLPWTMEVILKTHTGYDIQGGRFTFLHRDLAGTAVNLKLHKNSAGEMKQVPGVPSMFYSFPIIQSYSKTQPIIYCEGEPDFLSLLSTELYQPVTHSTGAGSIPKDLSALKDFSTIIILFDNDKAGKMGSTALAKRLKTEFPDMEVRIVGWEEDVPKGFDITDFFNGEESAEVLIDRFDKILATAEEYHLPAVQMNPREFRQTDAGNAELLLHLKKDLIRFNHTTGAWYIWNGQFWQPDMIGEINQLVIEAARQRQSDAVHIDDDTKKKYQFRFGLQSENKNKIKSCLDLAKGIAPVATIADQWNQHQSLIQFNNGLLNLSDMSFNDGSPELMISQTAGIDYNPEAICNHWTEAISQIFDHNQELVDFFKRAAGYSLTSSTTEQCFFLLFGAGANGKSVILEILRCIFGDYATDTLFATFERKFDRSQSNDLARLHSKRIVTSAESGSTRRLDEERIKAITGGDPITARYLYQEFFQFHSGFKLWLAVNSLPKVGDFSDGFWRRVRLIPFNVVFKGDKADQNLVDKLKSELPGIVNWAIEGYIQWKEIGLSPPAMVIQATTDYQNEQDVVAEFLNSHISRNVAARIKASTLYLAFCTWHKEAYTEKPLTQTAFGRRVSQVTGLKSEKISGIKWYFGIELTDFSNNQDSLI